jgi:hypothetical protein
MKKSTKHEDEIIKGSLDEETLESIMHLHILTLKDSKLKQCN